MAQSMGHIAATVSLDINPFKASNSQLRSMIRSTTSALKAQDAAIKGSEKSLNGMNKSYQLMGQQLRNYQAQMVNAQKVMNDTSVSQSRRINASNQYNKASAEVEKLRARMTVLGKEITLQSSQWTKVSNSANKFGNTLTSIGSKASSVGSSMTRSLTAPIVAGLAYAGKQLVDYQDKMIKVRNIIRTSDESASETQASYNAMLKDSRKYSDKYGVSQIKIAQGYEDLVKRGYTSKAAIGVMDSELKASIATGDDFNNVIKVASETMESFGLATTKTGKPIKNSAVMQARSKKTLNELSYAADATSTDFQSLGIGMSYVGATAHQAGFKMSETAAAMGILSNNGLEADKAGTGLRKAINSLITPTANGQKALSKINLTTKDFLTKSGKVKSMSAIFKTLNSHMKGLSANEKQDIFHALFGTTGQQAGAILTENAKRLGELNSEVEKANKSDYISTLSKKNLTSAKSQIAIAKESLTNAGMDIAKNVLPAITPLIQDVGKAAQAFGRLDPSVQKAVAKFVVFTAAAGPLMSILGKIVGFGGNAAKAFGTLAGGIGRATSAAKLGGSAWQILRSGFSKSAYEAANFGSKAAVAGSAATSAASGMATLGAGAETAGASTALAGASLSSLAIGAGVAVAAIGVGVAVWELWGKEASASAERTNRWGSDVGAAADKSLQKFKSMSSGIKGALTDMQTASQTTTKQMRSNFNSEFAQMERDAKKHLQGVEQAEKGMSTEVAAAVERQANKERKQYVNTLADAQDARTTANNILKTQPNGKVSDLSDTQRVMLANSQQQLMNDELKIWNITGEKRKKALAVLNQDITKMNRQQRNTTLADLRSETATMDNEYNKQANNLKKQLNKGTINQSEYRAGMKANEKALSDYVTKASAQYIKMAKANGQSTDQIKRDMQQAGLSYADGIKEIKRQSAEAERSLKSLAVSTEGLKGKTKKAADDWNKLVFDSKTGKVRTNAQEEVNKAVKSKNQWNEMKLLNKQGKMSTNAAKMVASALIANGQWNSMSWKEQSAWLHDKFSQTIVKALEDSGKWNSLTLDQKQAIVTSKGKAEMADNLVKFGVWNSLSLKQQEALVHTSGTKDVMDALDKMGKWNQLTPKQQEAIVNAKGGAELGQLLTKYGAWQGMPASVLKTVVAQDQASGNIQAANSAIQAWEKANPGMKYANAQDNASGPLGNALSKVWSWNGTGVNSKTAQGNDAASGPFGTAVGGVNRWNGTGANSKTATARDAASSAIQSAISKIKEWNVTNPVVHTIQTVYSFVTKGKKHANGTNYHTGGPMIVNDQKGPMFREMVQFPGQMPFVPFGRNVPINAPRGTKVLRASETARMFNGLPQYANGNTDAVSILSSLRAQPVTSVGNSGSVITTDQVNQLIIQTAQMVDSMGQMLGLNAAQLTAIKAGAFDKTHMYSVMGRDQIMFNTQQL
ncbi:UNVERIFIED_CONTAM: phage tail tape measure protein [Limosilactobacillus fermentum]|uniref:Phage tail tape measure protein n=1 Tax=Limosilactobacillus fermentum TaxID=1613 RepID=A0AAJ6D365_LIMFE|nr:phage tail tape measure protein [Limosilactobacillus fermentum]MED7634564.1 phage tail tape measure protein [Limosilactobacillus fermentum]WFR90199.1 phage tail tape measure protein [Limosilactobacillus fermentum]